MYPKSYIYIYKISEINVRNKWKRENNVRRKMIRYTIIVMERYRKTLYENTCSCDQIKLERKVQRGPRDVQCVPTGIYRNMIVQLCVIS